jgi:hypothetical protein
MSDLSSYIPFSLTDTDLIALVTCPQRRLVIVAPGFTIPVAQSIVTTWNRLGAGAVRLVLDPDPEVCRMGFGELAALQLLYDIAERLGTQIYQQQGIRVGVVLTDETTVVYAPAPLLVEAGGQRGDRTNAIRFEAPSGFPASADARPEITLDPTPVTAAEVQKTTQNLRANPPMKFDIARKVRVFNSRIEFVEFKLVKVRISRMTVTIPSDLIHLIEDTETQRRFRGAFQLIGDDDEVSTDALAEKKEEIARKYLISLKGYGAVILRDKKDEFMAEVASLQKELNAFRSGTLADLQKAIDRNRETLFAVLLPGVSGDPPARWENQLSIPPRRTEVERLLQADLAQRFGSAASICREMKVNVIFKGVTYEALSAPKFIEAVKAAIPWMDFPHEEFDAARSQAAGK